MCCSVSVGVEMSSMALNVRDGGWAALFNSSGGGGRVDCGCGAEGGSPRVGPAPGGAPGAPPAEGGCRKGPAAISSSSISPGSSCTTAGLNAKRGCASEADDWELFFPVNFRMSRLANESSRVIPHYDAVSIALTPCGCVFQIRRKAVSEVLRIGHEESAESYIAARAVSCAPLHRRS